MDLKKIPVGDKAPEDVFAVIEIPAYSDVKYELCKESGMLFVDRFLSTPMSYPCHYGFIPHTLGDDGDPLDILVLCPKPLLPGSVIHVRPIGVLLMSDEKGQDEKILSVPLSKITPLYDTILSYKDIPQALLQEIKYFFEHYKDLEPGKSVKVDQWHDVEKARELIQKAIHQHENK